MGAVPRVALLGLLVLLASWGRPVSACDIDCGSNGNLDDASCSCNCNAWYNGEHCENSIIGGLISGFLIGFLMAGAVGALVVIKWYLRHIQGMLDEEDGESGSSDMEEGKPMGTPKAPKHMAIKSGYSTVQSASFPTANEEDDAGVNSRGARSAADALGRELETAGGLRSEARSNAWRWGARPPSESENESSKGSNSENDDDEKDENEGGGSSDEEGTAEESSSDGSESSVDRAVGYQGPMGGAPAVRGMGPTEVVSVSPTPRNCSTPTAGGSLRLTLTISCDPGRFQTEWPDAGVVASRCVNLLAMPEQQLVERDLEEHGIFTVASGTVESVQKYYLFSERLADRGSPACVFLTELIVDGSAGQAKPQLSVTLKSSDGADGMAYLEHLDGVLKDISVLPLSQSIR